MLGVLTAMFSPRIVPALLRGVCTGSSVDTAEDASIFAPQFEQKVLSSGISFPHDGQNMIASFCVLATYMRCRPLCPIYERSAYLMTC